ncbi:hypothetical protein EVAR_6592_1 [Eumeta japonica]|uniref:Uncharacterized protein n=1 Tax=Eumeta variegata TaxID=151549 RepID=A0A4C1TK42_EUMVA|nr:hypothetical protein EVAR_6592_1 [Eumeta japonica]
MGGRRGERAPDREAPHTPPPNTRDVSHFIPLGRKPGRPLRYKRESVYGSHVTRMSDPRQNATITWIRRSRTLDEKTPGHE